MVFNASLGYDPDEWEECPHKEQFMVFSFFTRLLLSSAAVIFVYIFFRLIENNNSKEDEKDRRKFVKSGKKSVDDADYTVAGTAEDLLKEAQDYMQGIKVKVSPPEADMKTKHQFYDDNKKETFAQYIEEPRRRAEEAQRRASPVPEEQFVDVPSKQWGYQPGTSSGVAAGQVPPDQWSQPRTTAQLSKRISREDEEALRQWEMERERLEAERLAKLQDHEVGGDDSELTSSGLLPASHISFQSQATPEGELDKRTQHIQPGNGLERKLMSEIGQIAEASPAVKRERGLKTVQDVEMRSTLNRASGSNTVEGTQENLTQREKTHGTSSTARVL
ncbi:unnamed protein product [Heligmosomoides polygyrus]|uniref:Protein lap4 n=1 Tax=Heligmosomoides polygyrus TaxID=6339 RepID=A0A3P8A4K8_HELPZ|nr:unnamed protein product [Heligmosomoides polygyrus]